MVGVRLSYNDNTKIDLLSNKIAFSISRGFVTKSVMYFDLIQYVKINLYLVVILQFEDWLPWRVEVINETSKFTQTHIYFYDSFLYIFGAPFFIYLCFIKL